MPAKLSPEELQLRKRARRRLIGAIVLVLLVVVALPRILDQEPKPVGKDITIRVPAQDSGPMVSKPISGAEQQPPISPAPSPAPATSENEPGMPAASKGAGAKPETETRPAAAPAVKSGTESKPPASTVAKSEVKPAEQKSPDDKSRPKPSGEGQFIVQLGTFANSANARQLQQKVAAKGFKTYTDIANSPKGKTTRVRVGPFPTREEAERAQAKLRAEGWSGVVASK
jgi:DedD protein